MYLKLNLKPINTNDVERCVKIWELEAHPTSLGELGSSSCTQGAPAVAGMRPGQQLVGKLRLLEIPSWVWL